MPPKKPVEPPLVIPPLPTKFWKAHELEESPLDLANAQVVQFSNKPNGKFPGDYLVYCALLQLPPHPALPRNKGAGPIEAEDVPTDKVDIRHSVVDSRTLSLLMLALRPLKAITTLAFFNAGLSDSSLKILVDGLAATSIVTLKVDYNPLDEQQSESVLGALVGPTSKLITLSLRGNGLTDKSAAVLCEGLKSNMCLQSLNLFDNRVTDEGAQSFVGALQTNTQLGQLSLGNNQMTGQGARVFAGMFDSGIGKSLQLLNLSSNHMDPEAIKELLTSLSKAKDAYPGLKAVALHRNKVAFVTPDLSALLVGLEAIQISL